MGGGDLTRLACLWSQQELCGRRPKGVDPFEWVCHGPNVDSFLLFVKLKQLPMVPIINGTLQAQPPSDIGAIRYNLFDDEEGDDWLQDEPDDWWQQEPDDPDMHIDVVDGAVNHEGESVQAALNSRLRRSTRMTFFDDESGDEEM